MTQPNATVSRPLLPVLLLLFVGSGCAALIYEIVWLQLLQLVLGSSAVSLAALLGTFMGGMCLGSLLLPRVIPRGRHPLRVYAQIEFGIALVAIVVLFLMPYVGGLYSATSGQGVFGLLVRGLLCAICLLPPTMLMGATLPAIARWITATREGISWLGFFYGGNIAGAVFGCLLAGFYLLRVHDMVTATFVAVAINLAIGAIAWRLSRVTPYADVEAPGKRERLEPAPGTWSVYVAIALSGLTALGAEVVWTRILSLILGATVYTFSIILAVFLVGLGIGSSAGSAMARRLAEPRLALSACQWLLTAAIAWTAWMLASSVPYWPINPSLAASPWFIFQIDILRCAWSILPATVLWGASFPLALAAAASRGQDPGRLVGGVYAANTVGAIAGAVGFSLVAIPDGGTQQSEKFLIAIAAVAALAAMGPLLWGQSGAKAPPRRLGASLARELWLPIAIAVAVLLYRMVPGIPPGLIAYGRYLPTRMTEMITYLYVGEGMNSSIAVSDLGGGIRNFHVSGKVEASSEPQDMRLQRMLGNIPALFHPSPKSVLVVGFGAGVTAGSFIPYPELQRLVICEIEPLIPQRVAPYFAEENFHVLQDPRVQVFYDDARHFVLTTPEKFDIITSDPIHPWVKGAATLYTKEYFELVKRHLNPGGLVTQWVPLYESNLEVVKSEIATFFDAFPHGTIWANLNNGEGYDLVLLGQMEPLTIDLDRLAARIERPDYTRVYESLRQVGFNGPIDLIGTYGGQASDLSDWMKNAAINRDRNLRLQYMAGMGASLYRGGEIYNSIAAYRRFPATMFTGSPQLMDAVRTVMNR
jgi:spermidine synthase